MMDKIMIMNGNSSSNEKFKKDNRSRDVEITLYTIEIKPDNTENKTDAKNEKNNDIKKEPDKKTEVDEKKDNNTEQDSKKQNEEDKKENNTPEKIIQNFNYYMEENISLRFVAGEIIPDEDKNANEVELDKVMDKINIQILGEKKDTKDNIDKKKTQTKSTAKKPTAKKINNKKTTNSKTGKTNTSNSAKKAIPKQTVTKKDKPAATITKKSDVIKLENDSEGRVLVSISLNDSMEYQGVDLKSRYMIRRIDFRTKDDEYYKGSEPDRTAITEITFFNKGKKLPFKGIDAMKEKYIANYNQALRESISCMNFVIYENNDVSLRLEIKEDGAMEFIDRFKCKNKGDSDCTSAMMPVMWRITDGRLYMRYHTIWRLWKYELDSQSDIINHSEYSEPPRWMKIYFKSDNGFADKYLNLVRRDGL
jgi:hypothetical protein